MQGRGATDFMVASCTQAQDPGTKTAWNVEVWPSGAHLHLGFGRQFLLVLLLWVLSGTHKCGAPWRPKLGLHFLASGADVSCSLLLLSSYWVGPQPLPIDPCPAFGVTCPPPNASGAQAVSPGGESLSRPRWGSHLCSRLS